MQLAGDRMLLEYFILIVLVTIISCTTITVDIKNFGTFDGITEDVSYPSGGKVKKEKVDMFLGIPYAKPPVGRLRLAKPEPIKSYRNTLNATRFRPMCTQINDFYLPVKYPTSEDCLYLNIYRPQNARSLAVMVFIHGGFSVGDYANGGSNYISGDVLAVYADIIVVTFNYRLGILGFYATDDVEGASRGNYGLWDQHTVLQWVHEHIGDFGGNPNRVTLAGQQTGAICALYQAMYLGNKGLFQQVITQSGSPIELAKSYEGAFTRKPESYGVSHSLGCLHSEFDSVLSCLRNMSYDKLVLLLGALKWPVSPAYDGEFILVDPEEMLNPDNRKYADVQDFFGSLKMIIGHNDMDGLTFFTNLWVPKFMWHVIREGDYRSANVNKEIFENVIDYAVNTDMYGVPYRKEAEPSGTIMSRYYNVLEPDNYKQTVLLFTTDYYYLTPAVLLIDIRRRILQHFMTSKKKLHQTKPHDTYLYKFTVDPDFQFRYRDRPDWAKGANLGDELPFLFGFSRRMLDSLNINMSYAPSEMEINVSEQIMTKWGEFVKRGSVESIENSNDVVVPKWPSCFETSVNNELTTDISHLRYWEISVNDSKNKSMAQIKTDFTGVMGRFWMSLKQYVEDETGDVTLPPSNTGELLGLDPSTLEILVIVLIVFSCILIIVLVFLIIVVCLRKRNANYDTVIEMEKNLST